MTAHPHPLKDIARQAGVGLATVDRVVHARGGVRPTTADRVHEAMGELARQRVANTLSRSRFVVDLVMDAPRRFTGSVRDALEAELHALRPAALRVRAHLTETATVDELCATLAAIGRRGSHGVLLKAPDGPAMRAAVDRLAAARIPVVTLVTDLTGAKRLGYVGADNRSAGRTAAFLLARWSGTRDAASDGAVLITSSSRRFVGEEERAAGFREIFAVLAPSRPIVAISEGRGIDGATGALVRRALASRPDIRAVYSIGGGNAAIVDAFRDAGRPCDAFIGHDLDRDNRRLLEAGSLDAVLVHDLGRDMRRACTLILEAHRVLPPSAPTSTPTVGIVTRFNLPPDA